MTIIVNHKEHSIAQGYTIEKLVRQLKVPLNGIAIAVNNAVISRNQWSETKLQPYDAVTIIQATQGG